MSVWVAIGGRICGWLGCATNLRRYGASLPPFIPIAVSLSPVAAVQGGEWSKAEKIVPADAEAFDQFGFAVAVHSDYLVVGAIQRMRFLSSGNLPDGTGVVYVYERSSNTTDFWTLKLEIQPDDVSANAAFGAALAFDGLNLFIGAPEYNEGDTNGAVFLYNLDVGVNFGVVVGWILLFTFPVWTALWYLFFKPRGLQFR